MFYQYPFYLFFFFFIEWKILTTKILNFWHCDFNVLLYYPYLYFIHFIIYIYFTIKDLPYIFMSKFFYTNERKSHIQSPSYRITQEKKRN